MSEEHGLLFVEYKDSLVQLLSGDVQRSALTSLALPFLHLSPPLQENTHTSMQPLLLPFLIIQLSLQLHYY